MMQDPNLIIQPAGHNTPQTWKNFEHTILTPVPIDIIRKYAGDDVADALDAIYPSRSVPTWGLEPHNQKKVWSRMRVGDPVLFVGDKRVFMSGTVSFEPLHSRELALALWGLKKNRQTTWEYIYFVDDLHKQNMPYTSLAKLVGYSDGNNFRSAAVLDHEKSKGVFEVLGLESQAYSPPVALHEPYEIAFNDSFVADREVVTKVRGEQKAFRDYLFRYKRYEKCGICLKEYPVEFLATAHIKRREACNDGEKLDSNIVMPMCVFGCDALYERGYIGVDVGTKKVFVVDDPNSPETVRSYLLSIDGNSCSYMNDKTVKYFEYHNQQMVYSH